MLITSDLQNLFIIILSFNLIYRNNINKQNNRDENGQMDVCDVSAEDRLSSKELRERYDNLGTTAKQTAMVWACVVKRR